MKKFITLVLVLVLALGLTVPAMAFTSDTSAADDSIPYTLKVYLVEYDDNDLFGFVTLPESDRGYAKNEIVAAVVELNVPDGENPIPDYTALEISGDNVDFKVTDTPIYSEDAVPAKLGTLISDGSDGWTLDFSDKNGDGTKTDPIAFADDTTYSWLVFAKVTDDDASITAKLVDGTAGQELDGTGSITTTLDGIDYVIARTAPVAPSTDFTYTITVDPAGTSDYADAVITIDVDKDNVSLGMSINPAGAALANRALGVNTKNELGIVVGATIVTGDDAADYLDIYNDVVVDVFGLDYFLIGNYVRDSFFNDLTSSDTLVATVDIAPWTAYVTVPDSVVVDPPKTGDAASIMGFVMVALSGAGVVALRKRG